MKIMGNPFDTCKNDVLFTKAIEWQQARGSRSGRVAWQFVSDLAGRSGVNISKVLYKSLQ